jgi:hypothetical protein
MADERAAQALERIERALSRIEAAGPPRRDDGDLRELRNVHDALRGKVESAISQLDRLLASGGTA